MCTCMYVYAIMYAWMYVCMYELLQNSDEMQSKI